LLVEAETGGDRSSAASTRAPFGMAETVGRLSVLALVEVSAQLESRWVC
jgi:hypothetical protein